MALPKLTDEQRKAALEKAAQLRTKRAKTKNAMKNGHLQAAIVLENLEQFDHMKKVRVYHFLISQPGIGENRALQIMEETGISKSRRLQGLGKNQRAKILELIEEPGKIRGENSGN